MFLAQSPNEHVKNGAFFYLGRQDAEFKYLIRVGSSDSYGVEEVFKAMRDRPEVQSHFVGHQSVSIVKQVDITPRQWTVLLKGEIEVKKVRGRATDCKRH